MSNVEKLVRGYLAAGDAGELDRLGDYLHEGVVVHDPGGSITSGLAHDMQTWRRARKAISGLRHEVKEVIVDGSSVAARVEISGTLIGDFAGVSGDGQEFAVDQAIFMHISEGKADELWAIVDSDGFRAQVGAT